MNEINNRVRDIVNYSKLNKKKFSERIGVAASTIGDILLNKKGAGKIVIERISKQFPEIDALWLISGQGDMLKTQDLPGGATIMGLTDFMNVPLVPIRGKAGYLAGYGDVEFIETLPTIPVIVDRAYKGKYRCFEVDGDSMDDRTDESIKDKDVVLGRDIKRELWTDKLHINAWNFIIVHKDGITIKRITDHDTETGIIKCHSLNSLYEDFELHLNNVIELYNLIKIVDRSTRL